MTEKLKLIWFSVSAFFLGVVMERSAYIPIDTMLLFWGLILAPILLGAAIGIWATIDMLKRRQRRRRSIQFSDSQRE